MPLYLYIIVFIIITIILVGLVLYYRSRKNYIYTRFKRFSEALSSSISGINNRSRDSDEQYDSSLTFGDQEDIKQLIDTFSLEFKQNSSLLDSLLDNMKRGILIIDENKKILKINESLSDLLYIDTGKIIGQKTILVFNNRKFEELIDLSIKKRIPVKEDIVFYGDQDTYLNIEALPVYFEDIVEATEKTLEKINILIIIDNATQEIEFSKLRSQFVANVSHEMRTPLTSIRGYMETILDSDLKEEGIIKDYLEKSLKEVEKLNFLIKDILNLSRIEYSRNILFEYRNDLVAIIEDVINSLKFLAKKNDIKIDFKTSKKQIFYNTDEELFGSL